jgi:hypothetical protein
MRRRPEDNRWSRPAGRGRRLAAGLSRWLLAAALAGGGVASPPALAVAGGPPRPAEGELCGTGPQGVLRALARPEALREEGVPALPTTQSYDRGDIAVIEDDGTLLYPVGSKYEADEVAIARAFYRTHGDDYDFLCIYVASAVPFQVFGGRAFAYEENVVSDVAGIGLGLWDYSLDFGSGGRLRSLLMLNTLAAYPADPWQDFIVSNHTLDVLAHEAGHRWSAFVQADSLGQAGYGLLGAGLAHWNFYFDNDASMLGGNGWADNGDGSWTTAHATERYGALELYLMGLAGPEEVGALPVLEDPYACTPPANYTRAHHPLTGVTCWGRPYSFTVADVIAANGPRVPDAAASPKHHRFAFVLVIANGAAPAPADLDKLNTIRALWPAYFAQLTAGRATADVTLAPRAGSVIIEHAPLKDTEDTVSPVTVTARVSVRPGSIPLAVDPAGVQVVYAAGGGPTPWTFMTESSPGVFTATIGPFAAGTTVYYRINAAADSAGIGAVWPAPDSSAVFRVGPDATPPQVALLPRPQTVKAGVAPYRFHALATDNLGVARVFAAYTRDGAGRDTAEMARAGASDTFYVDLWPDAVPGDAVTLEVRAVDGSAAAHAAADPGCPPPGCEFRWGTDWLEPLDLTDGGFLPAAVTAGRRDSWGWIRGAGAAGGGAWKCGDAGGLHYAQNLDAGLTTPSVPVPGVAELRLRHRYEFEAGGPGTAYDGGRVELSVAGGAWTPITPLGGYPAVLAAGSATALPAGTPVYSGRSAGWEGGAFEEAVFPLGDLGAADVRVRFRAVSDAYTGGDGWLVDDVRLLLIPSGVDAGGPRVPAELRFAAPWPNPARGEVRFAAELPAAARVRLEIVDVRGRLAGVAFDGAAPAGPWSAAWIPDGAHGVRAPAGVYLAVLRVTPRSGAPSALARRFVLLP